jgi:predicted molibdopterin-dependent oxidoreductase YjgC
MIGRKKSGIMPIRGHSGVQGSAECGADANKLPGGTDINDENCSRLESEWGHPIPRRAGLRAPELLDHAGEKGLDVLYLVGGNHLETMPDRRHAERALGNVKLRIHQDIVLNSSTLLDADEVLVLPAETRYEQKGGGTSTSTERRIRFSPEIPGPRIAEARAEWQIFAEIGRKLRPDSPGLFPYADSREIRVEMSRTMPLYAGIEKLLRAGDSVQWGGERLGTGDFPTPTGKAQFQVVELPRRELPEGQFTLTSRRGKQFNSMTWGRRDPLTGNAERSHVLMSSDEIRSLGLSEGDHVRLKSKHGELLAKLRAAPCRRRHVQAFWPECNVLLGRTYDPVSGEPDYNTTVTIERV